MPITEGREYAGFWRRVWAGTIDVSLEILVALLVSLLIDVIFKLVGRAFGIEQESAAYVTGFTFIVLLAVGGWLYAALSESSRYRATIGKRIMGLQVVNAEGGKLNFGQASARHMAYFKVRPVRARAPQTNSGAKAAKAAKPNVCNKRSAAVAPKGPRRLETARPLALLRLASSGE